jgi:crotonobetainyl-CoA:carnitine CoA-transferase CaiB-like acyl-CoA transferase
VVTRSAPATGCGPGGPPLDGMRVLDLSQQLPGPYATLLLASMGAAVTKVEPPRGDAARHLDPEMFEQVNAGKSTVTLDLKSAQDRARLHEMARDADVFVEGFRPGVTARLGCDHETLRRLRPGLVYCSVSGVGQSGPLAGTPTHDLSLQAMAGALVPGERLDRIGVAWVDLATGTSAALAITAAWHRGGGCHLDMSMLDAALAWTAAKPAAIASTEPTYGTVGTADGGQVVVALLEDAMWQRLCAALGWADWACDGTLATYAERRVRAGEVRRRLDTELGTRRQSEVLRLAERFDLPITALDTSTTPAAREQIGLRTRSGASPCVPLPGALVRPLWPAPELAELSTAGRVP